jgi:energy-coupling factor transporter ATP-binding protein EcfA2
MGLLLITHDLDVARDMADRVAVMYAGQIVEWASRDALYGEPRHPYTQKLFAVLPRLDRRGERLDSLPGRVPGAGLGLRRLPFRRSLPGGVRALPGRGIRLSRGRAGAFRALPSGRGRHDSPLWKRGARGDFKP